MALERRPPRRPGRKLAPIAKDAPPELRKLVEPLREMYKRGGMPLRDLEKAAYTSKTSLSYMLRALRFPSWAEVVYFARAHGRTPARLEARWKRAALEAGKSLDQIDRQLAAMQRLAMTRMERDMCSGAASRTVWRSRRPTASVVGFLALAASVVGYVCVPANKPAEVPVPNGTIIFDSIGFSDYAPVRKFRTFHSGEHVNVQCYRFFENRYTKALQKTSWWDERTSYWYLIENGQYDQWMLGRYITVGGHVQRCDPQSPPPLSAPAPERSSNVP